jgi:hypothetical protein
MHCYAEYLELKAETDPEQRDKLVGERMAAAGKTEAD